jgi:hypothetical protein
MRRRWMTLVLAVVIVFVLAIPVIPVLRIVEPTPCGTMPATCHASSLYLVSLTHKAFGVGGYFWSLSVSCNNTCNNNSWHYGFDT